MRTQKVIDKEIETLTKMKPKVAHHSLFGDDNHAAIQAQIDVLTNKLTESQIYTKYDDDVADCIYIVDSAQEAGRWMRGEESAPPSKDWEGLVK